MKISLGKSIDLKLLLSEIESIATVKGKEVSFNAFRIYELESILQSHINFPENISNISRNSIVQKTIKKVALLGFEEETFEEILKEELNNHLNKEEKYFFLLTSLSVSSLPFRKIKINNSEIIIKGKHFPKKFDENRKKIIAKDLKKRIRNEDQNYNDDFLKVIVKTKGRNFPDVFKESLKDLDVLRAILNLIVNPSLQIQFGWGDKPFNRIRFGKYLTMHYENGDTVNGNNFWWEPNFDDKKYILEEENKEKIKKAVKWYLKRIELSDKKFNRSICHALGLYVNAFDESNKQSCFLKVWTALETLLSTHKNDIIVRRCLAVYNEKSRPLQKQALEAVKNYRNEFVHEGIEASKDNLATYCFRIQTNILYLLRFNHLRFYSLFRNIEDANLFLDKRRLNLNEQEKEFEMLNTIKKEINTRD